MSSVPIPITSHGLQVACSACNLRELCMPVGLSDQEIERVDELVGARRKVPLPPLRKEEKAPAVLEAEATAKLAEREEHWRLLYVAMTRAQDEVHLTAAAFRRRFGKYSAPSNDKEDEHENQTWSACGSAGPCAGRSSRRRAGC